MQNFVQMGEALTLVAPYAVASGGGMLVGGLFAIAKSAAASGATVECKFRGVFNLTKAAGQSWTQGATLYWDNTAKNVTTTVGSNTKIGVAMLAQANADTVGRVLVTGQV